MDALLCLLFLEIIRTPGGSLLLGLENSMKIGSQSVMWLMLESSCMSST